MKSCMIYSSKGGINLYSKYLLEHLKADSLTWDVDCGWFKKIFNPILYYSKLRDAFLRYDIVHVQYHFAEFMLLFLPLLCLMYRKAKLVLTLHEDYVNLPVFVRWFHDFFYGVADCLIVHTQHHADLLHRHKSKIKVIPLGIVNRAVKKVQNDSGIILLPGFINSWKGHHLVLDAIKSGGLEDFKFLIVGQAHDKEYFDKLKSYGLKNVEFVNRFVTDSELRKYMDKCEFAVLPYTRITGSAMLTELIGFGVPVLLSDLPALKEATWENAEYFKSGDVTDLKQKLLNFRKIKNVVCVLFEDVANAHSWEVIANTTLKAYHNLYIERWGDK